MRLIGMMPCRNEDWVLELSARAAMMWCDALVIFNHASTDRSLETISELANEFPGRVLYGGSSDPNWREMEQRQAILNGAREGGATHLAIIDADEVLTGNLLPMIRVHVESMPPGRILQLPGYNLRGGLDQYHATGIWADRWFSTAFRDEPRFGWSGDRFHHREPADCMPWSRPVMQGHGGVMHLWGASERRLIAKHALYKMNETLRWPQKSRAEINQLYNLAFVPAANRQFDQNWSYTNTPVSWWEPYHHLLDRVRVHDIPWQEAECRKLHVEHGAERFAGLDLFGVVETVPAVIR